MRKITKILLSLAILLCCFPFCNVAASAEPIKIGPFSVNSGVKYKVVGYELDNNSQISNQEFADENKELVYGIQFSITDNQDESEHYFLDVTVDSNVGAGEYTFYFSYDGDDYTGTINVSEPAEYSIFGNENNPYTLYVGGPFSEFEFDNSNNNEINRETIYIYDVADANKKNLYKFGVDNNDFSIDLGQNNIGIMIKNNVASGTYYVEFKDTNANKYFGYIKALSSFVSHNGKTVMVGLGNSGEGGALYVNPTGAGSQVDQNNRDFGFIIGAAYVNEDSEVIAPVEQEFMNKLVSFDLAYDKTCIEIGNTPSEKQKFRDINGNDVVFDLYGAKYIGKIEKQSETKIITATFKFDLDGDKVAETTLNSQSFVSTIVLKECKINVSSLKEINDILASETTLAAKIEEALKENVNLEDNNYIYKVYFNLKAGNYDGYITSNITGYSNVETFVLGGDLEFGYDNPTYEIKEIRAYDETITNPVKIAGGIINNGGIYGVRGVDFVAPAKVGSEDTIGLYAKGEILSGEALYQSYSAADVHYVMNCTFTGYDYAIKVEGNSTVEGIEYCKFENNNIALYINSNWACHGSDSLYNTFVNNNVALYLQQLPDWKNPYQYVFRNNYFFNDGNDFADYHVSDNMEGTFFMYNCYYGTDYEVGLKNNNVRPSKIIYEDASKVRLITSPCIMFPENEAIYGLDVYGDGTNAFINGTTYSLNTSNIDKNTNLEIEVCDSEGVSNAKIIFGGAQ